MLRPCWNICSSYSVIHNLSDFPFLHNSQTHWPVHKPKWRRKTQLYGFLNCILCQWVDHAYASTLYLSDLLHPGKSANITYSGLLPNRTVKDESDVLSSHYCLLALVWQLSDAPMLLEPAQTLFELREAFPSLFRNNSRFIDRHTAQCATEHAWSFRNWCAPGCSNNYAAASWKGEPNTLHVQQLSTYLHLTVIIHIIWAYNTAT